jgi:hypothetical protein
MSKSYTSPTLGSAIEGFLEALHAAYPQIETEGMRPKTPGVFVGEIAGDIVQLFPRARGTRIHLMSKPSVRDPKGYVRFGFTKLKRGVRYCYGEHDEEMILLVWLMQATAELRAMTTP